jgi:hypothetical protein
MDDGPIEIVANIDSSHASHGDYRGHTGIFITLGNTENASRNIPDIGKNVPDTMCALGDIRNNFQHIRDTNNIRNNLSVSDIMRNHFAMFLIWRCLFSLYDNLLVI